MGDFDKQLERRRQIANAFYAFIFVCIFAIAVGSIAMFIIKVLQLD